MIKSEGMRQRTGMGNWNGEQVTHKLNFPNDFGEVFDIHLLWD